MLLGFLRPAFETDDGLTLAGGAAETAPASEAAAETADDFDKDRAMATIEKLRTFERQAKPLLKRLEALEAAETERKAAEQTEAERLQAEITKLKAANDAAAARLRRSLLRDAAQDAATRAGLAFAPGALADAVALGAFDDLTVEDSGTVDGIGDAVKRLQKARPYLFQHAKPDAPDINAGARGDTRPPVVSDQERERIAAQYRHTF